MRCKIIFNVAICSLAVWSFYVCSSLFEAEPPTKLASSFKNQGKSAEVSTEYNEEKDYEINWEFVFQEPRPSEKEVRRFFSILRENNPEEKGGFFEGDIRLAPRMRFGYYGVNKWREGVIPYEYNLGYYFPPDQREIIKQAMDDISDWTCVTFRAATTADVDYISIVKVNNDACWSFVGRIGGVQQVNFGDDCFATPAAYGIVTHELLHTVGLLHEHSRPDRDNYVTINWENIDIGKGSHFQTDDSYDDQGMSYDYESIMHYRADAFSKDESLKTIETKNNRVIGQRKKMTRKDIVKVRIMYNCPTDQGYEPPKMTCKEAEYSGR